MHKRLVLLVGIAVFTSSIGVARLAAEKPVSTPSIVQIVTPAGWKTELKVQLAKPQPTYARAGAAQVARLTLAWQEQPNYVKCAVLAAGALCVYNAGNDGFVAKGVANVLAGAATAYALDMAFNAGMYLLVKRINTDSIV